MPVRLGFADAERSRDVSGERPPGTGEARHTGRLPVPGRRLRRSEPLRSARQSGVLRHQAAAGDDVASGRLRGLTTPLYSLGCAAVAENFDPVAHNRAAWDREVDSGNEWTRPVGPDVIAQARAGEWSVVVIGHQPAPREWFPADLAGTAVLCLASGGGQQGPVLAAAG